MKPSERDIATFATLLASEGPHTALRYLNSGVPHRYTAVYRFEAELLRNVLLYDKRGQIRPEYLVAVPFKESFCQFVLRDQEFRTDDSARDERLVGHPYRGVVVSYHSVPVVRDDNGSLWGTMSHFDMSRHPLADSEFELLQQAAKVLSRHIPHLSG